MYCVAREQKTTYCVIYCNTPIEVAKEFNKNNENCFTEEMIEDYTKRMEIPQLKSKKYYKQIDGMSRYLSEETKKAPHSSRLRKCCFSKTKNRRILFQLNRTKSYLRIIFIASMKFALKFVKRHVLEI